MIRGSRRSGPNSLTDAIAAGSALLRSSSKASPAEKEFGKNFSRRRVQVGEKRALDQST